MNEYKVLASRSGYRGVNRSAARRAAVAALAAAVMLLGDGRVSAAQAPAQAGRPAERLQAVHIKARMRTLPREDFEWIGPDHDFVAVDLWKRFGPIPKWRVEKAQRIAVMDGAATILWVKPETAVKRGPDANMAGWLKDLLDIEGFLHREVDIAMQRGARLAIQSRQGSPSDLLMTVETKARRASGEKRLKNTSLAESDSRQVFSFDAQTKRLKKAQVFIRDGRRDILVFETTEVEIDPSLPDALFSLTLPADIEVEPGPQAAAENERYQKMGPEDTSRAFLQACADRQWDEAAKFLPRASQEDFKASFGGLKILKIGSPFRSGGYGGWYVPYEIRLPSGEIKRWNLALSNDNAAGRYVVDGGF